MTDRAKIKPAEPAAVEAEPGKGLDERVPAIRRPGRPKGTSYARIDARVHKLMRQAILAGKAPSITKAAEQLVHLAYGWGAAHNKVRRLVRTFPYK